MARVGRGSALPVFTLCPPFPGSVVGPALTFRIRQNPQNFSLADVASQTGEQTWAASPGSCSSLPLLVVGALPRD